MTTADMFAARVEDVAAGPGVLFTAAGDPLDLRDPHGPALDMIVVARHLSRICRWSGALRHGVPFYSVAQHSVYVSRRVSKDLRLQGLLHDAAEAFVGDMATPLKAILPQYKLIENMVARAIRRRHGLPDALAHEVRLADIRMAATERRDLLDAGRSAWWPAIDRPYDDLRIVEFWDPERAYFEFMTELAKIEAETGASCAR